MKCPRCYEKIDKKFNMCLNCRLKTEELENKSNSKVDLYRKTGKNREVLKTTNLPVEIKKKHMLLWSGLLGAFGIHNMIAKNYLKGLFQMITTLFFIIVASIGGAVYNSLYVTAPVLAAISLVIGCIDFIFILSNKYKYPITLS